MGRPPLPETIPPTVPGAASKALIHIRAPQNLDETGALPGAKGETAADPGLHGKRRTLIIGVLAAAALGVAGWAYYVENQAAKPPPHAAPVLPPGHAAPVARPAPPAGQPGAASSYRSLAASPLEMVAGPAPEHPTRVGDPNGGLVDQAQNAITARRLREQDRIDSIMASPEAPARPVSSGTAAAPTIPVAGTAQPQPTSVSVDSVTNVAPDVTATTVGGEAASSASIPFRNYVAGLTIGGVFQGHPARALLNNRVVREGQMIDLDLGITFDHAEYDPRVLVFRDRTGATVSKRY